jgi:predicted  nucleic acid-binding Zn-ribbon protein
VTYHPDYEIGPKSPSVWKEVRRLEAEVERLRAQRKADRDNLTACRKRAAEQGNEVERLQEQLEMYAGMPASEVEAREAEVERLRAQVAADKVQNDGLFESEARLLKEVERLRADRDAAVNALVGEARSTYREALDALAKEEE